MTEILLAGDDLFEKLRRPFIARFDTLIPHGIARIRAPQGVRSALTFARERGLLTAVRCGGHSAAGFSSTEGLLIDVTPMTSIALVGENRIRVGAGALTGPLSRRLAAEGWMIPVGTCPSVGIAGLALGGGFGNLGRMRGFTCDHLDEIEIVLADGEIVSCSAQHDADLFWALRGAGAGSFGVVTALTFVIQPLPTTTVFELQWRDEHAAAVVDAWQDWIASSPNELGAELVLSAPARAAEPISVELQGTFLGDQFGADALLASLQAQCGAAHSFFCRRTSFAEALARQEATSTTDASTARPGDGTVLRQGFRISKSALFSKAWPPATTHGLVEHLHRGRRDGCHRSIEFAAWGGAYNNVAASETAFVHRSSAFCVQHIASLAVDAPAELQAEAFTWVTASWNIAQPESSGAVYQNFPDPSLPDWPQRYYGSNLQRLCKVKQAYDPGNVFRFEQSIPLTR